MMIILGDDDDDSNTGRELLGYQALCYLNAMTIIIKAVFGKWEASYPN